MSQRAQTNAKTFYRTLLAFAFLAVIFIGDAHGQTTGFTYQGRLTDAGNPATGMYDFRFKLFDSTDSVTGIQQGPTISLPSVQVTNGVFTVELDFGAGVFTGAARFLEIGLRPAGSPDTFNLLSPRQPVTATPYAVRSATASVADTATNAAQLGGLTPSSFIQNGISQQAATSFNIGGTGTATILAATTQFNLDGFRILKRGNGSLYAGVNAGSNSTGNGNSFFGDFAGFNNSTGAGNSFFGGSAGTSNTTGVSNSFFGVSAGSANTTGATNSFFGASAGSSNTSGQLNSFFGSAAGGSTTTSNANAFFGSSAGGLNTTGGNNTFFGSFAGSSNTTGSNNTTVGSSANVGANNLSFATAIGARAVVNTSNTVVLGRSADTVQIPGTLNVIGGNLGIGTTAPDAKLHVNGAAEGIRIQGSATGDTNLAYQSFVDAAGANVGYVGDGSTGDKNVFLTSFEGDVELVTSAGRLLTATSTGSIIALKQSNGTAPTFEVSPSQLGGSVIARNLYVRQFNELPSSAPLCWRVSNAGVPALVVTNCSSSARYKTDLESFSGGLDLIHRLNPVTFRWKATSERDVGLIAEEVAQVEPLFTFKDSKGQIEGVKYANLSVLFINAIKQQQKQISSLQQEIDALKALICLDRPTASACKSK